MALGTNTSALYLEVRNGKIYRYSKTNESGTTPVVNSKGETRYFYIYDYVEGHVTNFSTREEDYGGKKKLLLQIHLLDGDDNYVLKLDTSSSYFRMFCSVIPNIDWTKVIRFIPRMQEQDGVKKSSMITVNNGTPLKFAFTKDNPNGKPDIVVSRNKRNEIINIDRNDETEFFLKLVEKAKSSLMHPAVISKPAESPKKSAPVKPINDIDEFEEEDDLPF